MLEVLAKLRAAVADPPKPLEQLALLPKKKTQASQKTTTARRTTVVKRTPKSPRLRSLKKVLTQRTKRMRQGHTPLGATPTAPSAPASATAAGTAASSGGVGPPGAAGEPAAVEALGAAGAPCAAGAPRVVGAPRSPMGTMRLADLAVEGEVYFKTKIAKGHKGSVTLLVGPLTPAHTCVGIHCERRCAEPCSCWLCECMMGWRNGPHGIPLGRPQGQQLQEGPDLANLARILRCSLAGLLCQQAPAAYSSHFKGILFASYTCCLGLFLTNRTHEG